MLNKEKAAGRSRHFWSLQTKSLLTVLFAFAAAVLVLTATEFFGTLLIETVYLSKDSCEKRLQNRLNEFCEFVQEENISVEDVSAVRQWSDDRLGVGLAVYDGERLLYDTEDSYTVDILFFQENGSASTKLEFTDRIPDGASLYPVSFQDGEYQIFLREYSEIYWGEFVQWCSVGLALFSLVFVLIFFNGRIVQRIVALSKELRQVQTKDGTKEIHCSGNDEITALGEAAEAMRQAIILHYEKEQEALQSSNELVTSLSHDIRTPLTSLLIYTDAIADGSISNPEELKKYAGICQKKVHELKELTDTLFYYFLVFGQKNVDVQKQLCSFTELMTQLLSEPLLYLSKKGIHVEISLSEADATVATDPSLLKRVLDNLVSNLEKYADRTQPITLKMETDGREAKVTLQNCIAKKELETESSRIGLRTCEKILQLLGGSFRRAVENNGIFTAQFSIPIESLAQGSPAKKQPTAEKDDAGSKRRNGKSAGNEKKS